MAVHGGVSEDRVRVIVTDMLIEYEERVITPRHQETTKQLAENSTKLDLVKSFMQQIAGATKLATVVGSLTAFEWLIIQIVHAVKH